MINADKVRDHARGQWRTILPALGVPREALTNKHQPCPCCGGRDRFRFDDKRGSGSFICSHWGNGGGDGFALVQHWLNSGFSEALQAVAGVLGLTDGNVPEKRTIAANADFNAPEPVKDYLATLTSIWDKSRIVQPSDAVATYLTHRGLDYERIKGFSADALRFCPDLAYWHDGQCLGHYPAMVGCITDTGGQMMGLHRTFLQPADNGVCKLSLTAQGESLPAKKWLSRYSGSTAGCAIRLYPHNGRLAVAEGIETALAVREACGLPVWACLSAHGLQTLTLPDGLHELFIYADNDSHKRNVGFQAAHCLAVRAIKAGVQVHMWQAEQAGFDALDVLNQAKTQQAEAQS